MNIDHKLSTRIYQVTKDSALLRPVAIFCATSLVFMMITAVIFSCSPVNCDADFLRRTQGNALALGVPLFLSWLLTFALQKLIKRERPFEQERMEPLIEMVWKEPSFPSAHTAIAFATAMVSWWTSPDLFGPWLFVAALAVALSRVAVGVHYLSDVVMGAMIGFVVGGAGWYGLMWLAFMSPWH
jgi:membrane-associated phospholipid phosphatase